MLLTVSRHYSKAWTWSIVLVSLLGWEVLTAYSHTPARLHDLQKTWQVVHSQRRGESDEGRNETASRPRLWTMSDRVSPDDSQTIIDLYCGGMITKDVATEFGISLSSVRRLLRKHGARLSDCHGAAGR